MKRIVKTTSIISIYLFLILLIGSRTTEFEILNNADLRNVSIIIYLITSIYYYRIDSNEKNAKIRNLKAQLENKFKNE